MGRTRQLYALHSEPLSEAEDIAYQLTIDSFRENSAYSCLRRASSFPTKSAVTALQLSRAPSIANSKRKTLSLRLTRSARTAPPSHNAFIGSAHSSITLSTATTLSFDSCPSSPAKLDIGPPIQPLERLDCMSMSNVLSMISTQEPKDQKPVSMLSTRPMSMQPPRQTPARRARYRSNPVLNISTTIKTIPESALMQAAGILGRPSLAHRLSSHEAGIASSLPDVFDFELPGFDPRVGAVTGCQIIAEKR